MGTIRTLVVEPESPSFLNFREVKEPSPAASKTPVRAAVISLNRGDVRRVSLSSEPSFRPG